MGTLLGLFEFPHSICVCFMPALWHHHNRHHYHLREFNLQQSFSFFLHIEFESDLAGFLETNDFNKVDASCVEAAFLKVIMKVDKETMEK